MKEVKFESGKEITDRYSFTNKSMNEIEEQDKAFMHVVKESNEKVNKS
jgi:hypothetical protein